MIGRLYLFLAVAAGIWCLWFAGAAAQEVPEVPSGTPTGEKPIATEDYIKYWVKQISETKKPGEVTEARRALVNGYRGQTSPNEQTAYARISAEQVVVLLGLKDRVKQIQAAMALSEMPEIAMQPALEQMSRHKNPAVRFWAVRGYQRAGKSVMTRGGSQADTMLATLVRLGRSEPAGASVAAVFQALVPYLDARRQDVIRLRAALDDVWLARRKDIVTGRVDVLDAYKSAEAFLAVIDSEDNKRILQLLVDAMDAATSGFVKAENQKGAIAKRLKEFLILFEARLARMAQADQTPLREVLNEEAEAKQQSLQVRLRWNEYWKPLLKARGITPRPIANTTTAPAKRTTTTATAAAGK
jgi:hypothetical protein